MRTLLLAATSVAILSMAAATTTLAQNAAVSQMYGNGVHAFYAGNHLAARENFSTAINNGSQDPRTYYFRGIVAYSQGSTYEAESDWQQGARLEAEGKSNPLVGRSLTRFQGTGRLKLEHIRQKARLEYAALRAARGNQPAPQVDSAIRNRVINPQVTPPPPTVMPDSAAPATPPASPPAAEDPFADNLAEGEANVTEEDALDGAMDDPFADESAPAAGAGAPADDVEADPFAEGSDAPADSDDPFASDGDSDDVDPFAE